jgi:hypothetical protein
MIRRKIKAAEEAEFEAKPKIFAIQYKYPQIKSPRIFDAVKPLSFSP